MIRLRCGSISTVLLTSVALLACGKKQPAIGEHRLMVPAGCKIETQSSSGRIDCTDDAALSWLELSESSPDQALAKGEGIITEAMARTAITTSKPACTVAGQAVSCRRLDMKSKAGTTVALLAAGTIDGTA